MEVSDPPFPDLLDIKPTLGEIQNRIRGLDGDLLCETTRLTILPTLIFTMNSIVNVNRKLVKMFDITLNPVGLMNYKYD